MQQLAGCPMAVRGTAVAVADTKNGVALTFTTDDSDVSDLRTRVQRMGEMYGMHGGQGAMMWHSMGGEGMGHGSGMGMGMEMEHMAGSDPMPAARSSVTDTDNGARIELQPTEASQLDALRQHVRLHEQRMHSGECWMLQVHGTKE